MLINYKFNRLLPIYLVAFSLIFFIKCSTKSSTENDDSIAVSSDSLGDKIDSENVEHNSLASLILLNGKGLERSKSVGQSISAILKMEKLEMVDSASNFKSFTQYFHNSDDEFVDIQYYFGSDVVTAVNLDIYLNEVTDVKNLLEELTLKFTEKFGKPTLKEEKYTWKTPNKQQVALKDVSLKLAPGLQITFSKVGQDMPIQ